MEAASTSKHEAGTTDSAASAGGAVPGMQTVVIVGAGLAGSMLALYLARRKRSGKPLYDVRVFEKRGDFRARELAQQTTA